jgi:hypothetical protein
MTLKGNDLVITNSLGESRGYVLCLDKQYGEPIIHSKSAPNVPLNVGSSTPAQAGGQYDVRDSDGDKAISHIDWTLGAGQRSLDADGATPFRYEDSKSIKISKPGEITLLNEAKYLTLANVRGPVFSAMGYFFLGMNPNDPTTGLSTALKVSANGVTWVTPTVTASPTISAIPSCFASDGTNVYFGVSSGQNKGTWKGVYSGTWTFTKMGTASEEIKGLAFNGGQMFAAVVGSTSRVAKVNVSSGVVSAQVAGSKECTPVMFNVVTHVALVAAGNAVYWVVCQGNKSYIYKITYEPDTGAMMTEQYMEMPTGFIATCALGYLSTIYVGGYFESQTANVGKGAVYVCADGYSAPLFEIGEYPEETSYPANTLNDNRINAICEAGKDLYVATNRGAYRWDIDGGGFSHSYDLNSGGAGVSTITWNAGSEYSYDGSNMYNPPSPGPAHGEFPSKWTVSTVTGTPVWTHDLNIASLTGGTVLFESVPDGADVLNNATGSTMEFVTGPSHASTFIYQVQDGTKIIRFKITNNRVILDQKEQTYTCTGSHYHAWYDGSAWHYEWIYDWTPSGNYYWQGESGKPDMVYSVPGRTKPATLAGEYSDAFLRSTGLKYINISHPVTVRCVVKGNFAELSVNGGISTQLTLSLADTIYNSSTKKLSMTAPTLTSFDGWSLNSTSAYAAQNEVEVLGYGGVAHNKGILLSPYQVVSDSTSGVAYTGTAKAESGYLTQSETSFHSGTLLKDFRSMDVAHSSLPIGSTLAGTVWIDGAAYILTPEYGETKTRFRIDQQGYSIKTQVAITRSTSTLEAPVIKAVNVMWDFVKTRKHQYNLHCSEGAKNGTWRDDPQEAIAFLYATSDQRATFEDRFVGEYEGAISDVSFLEASPSSQEGYSGVLKVIVRESDT